MCYFCNNPAVMAECGFLSNNNEATKLNTEEYQKQMAFCIAMGIQEYVINKE
ncbi:MAG: N-acetylmuramoyl-L-alanine amidase [Acutalibacteraceae bacterium]